MDLYSNLESKDTEAPGGKQDETLRNLRSLYICDIPKFLLDKGVLKRHFSRFAPVSKISISYKRSNCIIHFENHESAEKAMKNGALLHGTKLNIFWSHAASPSKESEQLQSTVTKTKREPVVKGIFKSALKDIDKKSNFLVNEYEVLDRPAEEKRLPRFKKSKKGISQESQQGTEVLLEKSKAPMKNFDVFKTPAHSAEERYHVLEARDRILRKKRGKTSDLASAVKNCGICPDMCPEKERYLRECQHQVSNYELYSDKLNKNFKMDPKLAVKEYSRSSADQEMPLPHDLRPTRVLKMTMDYLLNKIINRIEDRNENLGDWYHFVWDRTRSIRKDITQQELCDEDAVRLVEQCARFHIHCLQFMVEEDLSSFDPRINTENLTKCLQTLKYMYEDMSIKGKVCDNEAEFQTYSLLLQLNNESYLMGIEKMKSVILSGPLQFALKAYTSINSCNYIQFFKLVKSTTYLNACILSQYFTQVRIRALRTMLKAYTSGTRTAKIPISHLTDLLAFENEEEAIEFCEHYELELSRHRSEVILSPKQTIQQSIAPPPRRRSYRIVESKRRCSVGEIVAGGPLPSLDAFNSHQPHNSFDENGVLKLDAWYAEDQIRDGTDRQPSEYADADLDHKLGGIDDQDDIDKKNISASQKSKLGISSYSAIVPKAIAATSEISPTQSSLSKEQTVQSSSKFIHSENVCFKSAHQLSERDDSSNVRGTLENQGDSIDNNVEDITKTGGSTGQSPPKGLFSSVPRPLFTSKETISKSQSLFFTQNDTGAKADQETLIKDVQDQLLGTTAHTDNKQLNMPLSDSSVENVPNTSEEYTKFHQTLNVKSEEQSFKKKEPLSEFAIDQFCETELNSLIESVLQEVIILGLRQEIDTRINDEFYLLLEDYIEEISCEVLKDFRMEMFSKIQNKWKLCHLKYYFTLWKKTTEKAREIKSKYLGLPLWHGYLTLEEQSQYLKVTDMPADYNVKRQMESANSVFLSKRRKKVILENIENLNVGQVVSKKLEERYAAIPDIGREGNLKLLISLPGCEEAPDNYEEIRAWTNTTFGHKNEQQKDCYLENLKSYKVKTSYFKSLEVSIEQSVGNLPIELEENILLKLKNLNGVLFFTVIGNSDNTCSRFNSVLNNIYSSGKRTLPVIIIAIGTSTVDSKFSKAWLDEQKTLRLHDLVYKFAVINVTDSSKIITDKICNALLWVTETMQIDPPSEKFSVINLLNVCLLENFVERIDMSLREPHIQCTVPLVLNAYIEIYNEAVEKLFSRCLPSSEARSDCNIVWNTVLVKVKKALVLQCLDSWPPKDYDNMVELISNLCTSVNLKNSSWKLCKILHEHITEFDENFVHDDSFLNILKYELPTSKLLQVLIEDKVQQMISDLPSDYLKMFVTVNKKFLTMFLNTPWWLHLKGLFNLASPPQKEGVLIKRRRLNVTDVSSYSPHNLSLRPDENSFSFDLQEDTLNESVGNMKSDIELLKLSMEDATKRLMNFLGETDFV